MPVRREVAAVERPERDQAVILGLGLGAIEPAWEIDHPSVQVHIGRVACLVVEVTGDFVGFPTSHGTILSPVQSGKKLGVFRSVQSLILYGTELRQCPWPQFLTWEPLVSSLFTVV